MTNKLDRFYNLPIIIDDIERKSDGWERRIKITASIKDLLDTWDIDDKNDMSPMTQVLRHLKNACDIIETLTNDSVN